MSLRKKPTTTTNVQTKGQKNHDKFSWKMRRRVLTIKAVNTVGTKELVFRILFYEQGCMMKLLVRAGIWT